MVQPAGWSQQESVRFEVAEDVFAYLIADCTARIEQEQDAPHPDHGRLSELQAEVARYVQERRDLDGTNPAEVDAVLARYGPLVKQRYQEQPPPTVGSEALSDGRNRPRE